MNSIYQRILSAALALFICLLPLSGCESPAAPASGTTAANYYTLENLPDYDGTPYLALHQNKPTFKPNELKATAFESYSELDALGRCGTAFACVGQELMPTEPRGAIGMIKPSGWQIAKYDSVDGKYLYNRCHLIGYQLTGENANAKNLITGTRALNMEGMLPFENTVADYIKTTKNHVLYRVTPIFKGNNLVANGVTIEALSVEDDGRGVCFYVYCYNAQPGIEINYANGKSRATAEAAGQSPVRSSSQSSPSAGAAEPGDLVVNTSTKKIHRSSCSAIKDVKPKNKKSVTQTCSQLMAEGYSPCRLCQPEK